MKELIEYRKKHPFLFWTAVLVTSISGIPAIALWAMLLSVEYEDSLPTSSK